MDPKSPDTKKTLHSPYRILKGVWAMILTVFSFGHINGSVLFPWILEYGYFIEL